MLIWRVHPGVLLVRASPLRCIVAFRRLDLPTFERPAKATSRSVGGGRDASSTAPATNSALVTRVSSVTGFTAQGLVRLGSLVALAGGVVPFGRRVLGRGQPRR